jgi:hypothetical protein
MVLDSQQFPQFVDFDPVLTEVFFSQYGRDLGMGGVHTLYKPGRSNKSKETDLQVGGFGDPVAFEGSVVYDAPRRGYEVEYSFDELVKGFAITRKMLQRSPVNAVKTLPACLTTAPVPVILVTIAKPCAPMTTRVHVPIAHR